MITLTRQQVRNLFTDKVFNRGMKYYEDKRINALTKQKDQNKWVAEVEGSEPYYVEVDMTRADEGVIVPFCECPAFDAYGSCKHVAAVMIATVEEKTDNFMNQEIINRFMNAIDVGQQYHSEIIEKIPMQVDYTLIFEKNDQKVWLEMRTGIDHKYVLRNIREFLEQVTWDQPYFFTKKFSYHPEQHVFLQKDQEIFALLQDYITTLDAYTSDGYYYYKAVDKRQLLLPPILFKQLLEYLQARQTTVKIGEETIGPLKLEIDYLPFQFEIENGTSDQYVLEIDDYDQAKFMFDFGAIILKDTIYLPTKRQLTFMKQIKDAINIRKSIVIPQVQKDRFFSESLPQMKQFAEVKLAENIEDEIAEYPLSAKLYLEEKDDMIVGNLAYHYGPYEIDPFIGMAEDTRVILVRDVAQEEKIMYFIEQSNFHYNGKELYMSLSDDEEVFEFLYKFLPELDKYVELFLTSSIRSRMLEREPLPTTHVDVNENSSLLDISFDISGINENEVSEVLQAVMEKKRYYRLPSGAIFSLENDSFNKVRQLFDDLDVNAQTIKSGQVSVPVYKGFHLDEMVGAKKYAPAFRKLLGALKHPEEQTYPLPEGLSASLRDYQETGYQWFKILSQYHLGGILADDMGLGKTLQTITYLLSEKGDKPHLIVVPSSVIYNWRNEIERFAPSLSVAIISGQPEERKELIETCREKDIWITSYGTIRQDIDLYVDTSFQTMILDEAQFIKNYQTKTSKAVRKIEASRKFALSGTPIENTIEELWAIFQVILPGLLPQRKAFRNLENERIAKLTKPFILRRVKEDVLQELPDKIETVHVSELTKPQKELYLGYLQELQNVTSQSISHASFQQNRMKILAGITRLRQICSHPSMFIENYQGGSGKLEELIDQVETMRESGQRMLIFSQFTSMHEIIRERFDAAGIAYFYLDGSTKAKHRVEMTESFNAGEKDVFLISLRAGGTGLNLTGADTVILLDLWWNPAVEDQAAGRAHRFGQKKVVQVIRFITAGTIEEKIYELQQKKRKLIEQVIQPGETMLSTLSEEEIKEILNV